MITRETLVKAAANLWTGENPVPYWSENEYMRGQVELIADMTPNPDDIDGDDRKDDIWREIVYAREV